MSLRPDPSARHRTGRKAICLVGWTALVFLGAAGVHGCSSERRASPSNSPVVGSSGVGEPGGASPAGQASTAWAVPSDEQRRNYQKCFDGCENVQSKHPEESPVDCEAMCRKYLTR